MMNVQMCMPRPQQQRRRSPADHFTSNFARAARPPRAGAAEPDIGRRRALAVGPRVMGLLFMAWRCRKMIKFGAVRNRGYGRSAAASRAAANGWAERVGPSV